MRVAFALTIAAALPFGCAFAVGATQASGSPWASLVSALVLCTAAALALWLLAQSETRRKGR